MAAQLALFAKVSVKPYGVLGIQAKTGTAEGTVRKAQEPGEDVAVVDPAGLRHIQRIGPRKAKGAAGAVYVWLGIHTEHAFPEAVRSAVTMHGHAKHHKYGQKACVHVASPDFRGFGGDAKEVAVAKLSVAYLNLLEEFLTTSSICLRMLPVSSGIFAGHLRLHMPAITAAALVQAICKLTAESQLKLDGRSVEMCIFSEEDYPLYLAAFKLQFQLQADRFRPQFGFNSEPDCERPVEKRRRLGQ